MDSEQRHTPTAVDGASTVVAPAPTDSAAEIKKKKKKKDKVRSAWISFAGRIMAQILGAIATVVLGIYVVSNYKDGADRATSSRRPNGERPAGGEASLAVLPFDNFSGDAAQEY